MIFNGIEKGYLTVLRGRLRPTVTELNPEVSVPVLISVKENETVEQIKEDISSWLYYEENKKLIFKDNPNRYYLAKLLEIDIERTNNRFYAEGEIIFTCEDNPYRFGLEQSINVTPTTQYATITGQAETPWTVEVEFTSNTNRFELWAGDIYLQLNYEFIAGDRLTVQYEGRKVILNGNDMRKIVSMSSNFAELQPGNVSVRSSHAAVLKYDERYY